MCKVVRDIPQNLCSCDCRGRMFNLITKTCQHFQNFICKEFRKNSIIILPLHNCALLCVGPSHKIWITEGNKKKEAQMLHFVADSFCQIFMQFFFYWSWIHSYFSPQCFTFQKIFSPLFLFPLSSSHKVTHEADLLRVSTSLQSNVSQQVSIIETECW